MINTLQLSIVVKELLYGITYSLCSFLTLKHVFFRPVKKCLLFSAGAGAGLAAAVLVQLWMTDAVFNIYPTQLGFWLLHTLLGWRLIADKSADSLISLVFAELFSVNVMNSMQTAAFSLIQTEAFWEVHALYCTGYLLSVGFVLLLKLLVKGGEAGPMSRLHMLLLTGAMWIVVSFVQRNFTMSDNTPDVSPAAAVPAVLVLLAVTALLLLSIRNAQAKHFRELSLLNEQYLTAQARHFELAREADTELRMLRHDMKNHILTMNGLYHAGKTEALGEYLAQLSSTATEVQAVTLTGNEIADAILHEKRKAAADCGAELVVSGSLKGLAIPSVLLCTILANLLDNATEAAARLPENDRTIAFTARRTGSFFYISVKNASLSYVDTAAELPTSKSDSKHHGLGLRSVKKAVSECGGTLALRCEEIAGKYQFQAEVILPVKAEFADQESACVRK